jgi:hypothetical protein
MGGAMTRSEELIAKIDERIEACRGSSAIRGDKTLQVLVEIRKEYEIAIQQNINLEKAVYELTKKNRNYG